jgi:hypothetical protein
MTILYSLYTSEGIVFAADSQITRSRQSKRERPQKKIRRIPRIGVGQGLLGYYGLAQVAGLPMSTWIQERMNHWAGSHEPEEFAAYMVAALAHETRTREKRVVSGMHFGAFRSREGRVEPVFIHVRNTYAFDERTGEHTQVGAFWWEEQFIARDVPHMGWSRGEVRTRLRQFPRQNGFALWYRNGDMALISRVANLVQGAFALVGQLPGYGPPGDLPGWERAARTLIITTTNVAQCLYSGEFPSIGGAPTVLSLPWPVV